MPILPFKGIIPTIHKNTFIAPDAAVIGDVHIGEGTNVWFQVVIRGDVNVIRIGKNTNIQDGTVVHVTTKKHSTTIGDHVTIGHRALLHGCELKSHSFVGMGAIVMDGAVVESNAMVAAGAMVTAGKTVPTGELWAGSPARFFRKLTADELAYIQTSADHYVNLSRAYKLSP